MTYTVTPVADLGDAELMLRVQADDPESFGALYDRFGHQAYRLAQSIGRDESRADDVVQEAFLYLWRTRANYRPERGTVTAWVMGTVRNRSIDSIRQTRRLQSQRVDIDDLEENLQSRDDTEEATIEREQAAHLRTILARLPEAQREVIALAYFGELSASEIASQLSLPLGTVKGRMRLGLQKLRTKSTPV